MVMVFNGAKLALPMRNTVQISLVVLNSLVRHLAVAGSAGIGKAMLLSSGDRTNLTGLMQRSIEKCSKDDNWLLHFSQHA